MSPGCSDNPEDPGSNAASDAQNNVTADTTTSPGDATAADGALLADGGGAEQCKAAEPLPAPDAKRTKFAMSLFHFNVEYVIGGLDYTDASGTQHLFEYAGAPSKGWTDPKVEDWIITETFLPILVMYEKHPTWGVSIELQGYMVEVLAARHPTTLKLLRKLAQRGQVELISFHYNAQLFLAFATEDLHRSIVATRAVFKEHCLPLSGVVFNQEGQAGEGRQKMLVDEGYTIGVYPKNLWQYVQHNRTPWPVYSSEGGALIVGPGGVDAAGGVEVAWDFFDDGEVLAAKSKLNPYFAPAIKHDPKRVADFEAKLAAREKSGFYMATVTDYVAHLKARKVEMKAAPPLVDGTWQAKSTQSIHRWLGGRSDAFEQDEQDNRVRTLNTKASMHVRALTVLADALDEQGKLDASDRAAVDTLWRLLWRAEVSDCSGVNPWRGEVLFGIDTSEKILADAEKLRAKLLAAFGTKFAKIDLKARTVTPLDSKTPTPASKPVDAPIAATAWADERTVDMSWSEVAANHFELAVTFGASESAACTRADKDDNDDCDGRRLTVGFPRYDKTLRYTPALIDDEVREYDQSKWAWQLGEIWLPLANGLIGLGQNTKPNVDAHWWVIKHVRDVHIAARIKPDVDRVDFEDAAVQPPEGHAWRFTVFKGSAKAALELANRINVWPVVQY